MPIKEIERDPKQILYSCYSHISREGEQFISEHVFGYVISGGSESYIGGKTYSFKEGDFRFFRKNQLTKYTKYPPVNGEYKSISIRMDQQTLRNISTEYDLHADKPYKGDNSLILKPKIILPH